MKKLFILLVVSALFISTGSMLVTNYPANLNSDLLGQQDFQSVDPFSGIHISISADVYYATGGEHGLRIEGDQDDIDDLEIEVRDGVLSLEYKNQRMKRSRLTIHITSRELDQVKISGSAEFSAEKALDSEEMDMVVSGSGKINLPSLIAKEVGIKISGSGDVIIKGGSADECDAIISGSGKLLAEDFSVSEFSTKISGSGSCRITANKEIEAIISGSGSVYYHGSPEVDATVSGSGKVRSL